MTIQEIHEQAAAAGSRMVQLTIADLGELAKATQEHLPAAESTVAGDKFLLDVHASCVSCQKDNAPHAFCIKRGDHLIALTSLVFGPAVVSG